jgi:integrase
MNPLKTWTRKDPVTGAPKKVYVIDFFYADVEGVRRRYRRDAKVQIKSAAESEAKRLFLGAVSTGVVPGFDGDAQDGEPDKATHITFGDAVKEWKASWVKKHSTLEGYEINLDAHLLPRFKDRPIDTIGFADVSQLRADLKDRAVSTVNNVEVALRSVLRLAVAHKKLAAMPALPALREVKTKLVVPPTIEEVNAILAVAYPSAKVAIALAAFAGLRAGEIRALRFRDVDFQHGIIRVRLAICRGVEGPPKSGHERQIPIVASLMTVLEDVRHRAKTPEAYVSLSSRGSPWADGSLLHAFNAVLNKVKLPSKRLHDLRHFFVTECFQAGIDAPDVQRLAGHIHLHVTQRYAHTTDATQRAAIEKFGAHLAAVGKGVETVSAPTPMGAAPSATKRHKS